MERPDWNTYFMDIAKAVQRRSGCERRHFGAVIVGLHQEIVSTGYNGTPSGVANCYEGGCPRCNGDMPPGSGYDLCLCAHAEENALLLSPTARLSQHTMYTTGRPCFMCLRFLITKRLTRVFYLDGRFGPYADETEDTYQRLAKEGGVTLLAMLENNE